MTLRTEEGRSIKEIVRTLLVSRATVRKVIRGEETTEFRYTARAAQPSPKLGAWIKDLTEILEAQAKLPRRERRSTQRLFETLRGRGVNDTVKFPTCGKVKFPTCGCGVSAWLVHSASVL